MSSDSIDRLDSVQQVGSDLTPEVAISMLEEGDHVHVFTGGPMFLGADWLRAGAEETLRQGVKRIWISGEIRGHRVAAELLNGRVRHFATQDQSQ